MSCWAQWTVVRVCTFFFIYLIQTVVASVSQFLHFWAWNWVLLVIFFTRCHTLEDWVTSAGNESYPFGCISSALKNHNSFCLLHLYFCIIGFCIWHSEVLMYFSKLQYTVWCKWMSCVHQSWCFILCDLSLNPNNKVTQTTSLCWSFVISCITWLIYQSVYFLQVYKYISKFMTPVPNRPCNTRLRFKGETFNLN